MVLSHIILEIYSLQKSTDEQIIYGKDKGYNYILNLETNEIYQSTDRIDSAVRNLYSEMMGIGGRLLKGFSTYDNSETHVSMVLRPMIYGTPDIMKLERVILRTVLYNLDHPLRIRSLLLCFITRTMV